MTALVMLARGEFRVLYWCRPMPACISGNKLWHPDGYLIWCPRTGFRPAQQRLLATSLSNVKNIMSQHVDYVHNVNFFIWSFTVATQKQMITRMHSSRVRTARLLPISPSMHCSRGVYLAGGVPAWGVYLPGGTCPGGTCPGGYLPGGGVPARGVLHFYLANILITCKMFIISPFHSACIENLTRPFETE